MSLSRTLSSLRCANVAGPCYCHPSIDSMSGHAAAIFFFIILLFEKFVFHYVKCMKIIRLCINFCYCSSHSNISSGRRFFSVLNRTNRQLQYLLNRISHDSNIYCSTNTNLGSKRIYIVPTGGKVLKLIH